MKRCAIHNSMQTHGSYLAGAVVQRGGYCWKALADTRGATHPQDSAAWALYTACSAPAPRDVCPDHHELFKLGRAYFRGDIARYDRQCWVALCHLNGLFHPGYSPYTWNVYKHAEPLPPGAIIAATPDERLGALEF